MHDRGSWWEKRLVGRLSAGRPLKVCGSDPETLNLRGPHAVCVQGASDDILNAKNTLYQHLTWDPDKAVSLCSKLALPLATPAVGVTPPVSPKSTTAEGECTCLLGMGLRCRANTCCSTFAAF